MQAEHRQIWKASVLLAGLAIGACVNLQAADTSSIAGLTPHESIWDDQPESAIGWKSHPLLEPERLRNRVKTSAPVQKAGSTVEVLDNTPRAEATTAATIEQNSEQLQSVLRKVALTTGGVGLAGVIGLWLFRSWLTQRRSSTRLEKSLEVLDSLRIGPRCGVYLVQADGHRVLIGIDQGRTMQMLTLPASFAESLQDATSKDGAEADEAPKTQKLNEAESSPFRNLQRFWQSGVA